MRSDVHFTIGRSGLSIVPCTITAAKLFVRSHHRHNRPPLGGLFAVAAAHDGDVVGVAVVGRPIARMLQDGVTAEVTRCCVRDGSPLGTCSALYAACWRAARALGWSRLITYTLQSESGASLRGSGWTVLAQRGARNAAGWRSREGRVEQAVVGEAKLLWCVAA